jgi:cytochrome c oxidase assembly protein subunit 15
LGCNFLNIIQQILFPAGRAVNFAAAMEQQLNQPSSKPIAIWLLVGVGMIMIQILLGGITRLTGSGLSITEWDVITGALPPMNEAKWVAEFDQYKQTPQYNLLNFDFTLKDFKFIFFWEWFHRFWARLIGVVFIIPFMVFLVQKRFRPSMVKPMLILFLLGALQGAIGWIMVASGLTGDAIYVQPVRLVLHFIFALGLLCYTFWFAMILLVPEENRIADAKTRKLLLVVIILFIIQLIYGALMAGHKAATAAPTWPDINGHIIPPGMIEQDGGLLNLIDNKIAIHFFHRGLAYLLLVFISILTVQLYRIKRSSLLNKTRWWPMFLILGQVVLGVIALLSSSQIVPNHWGLFEWMAQLHQLVAMFLLLSLCWLFFILKGKK